MLPLSFKEYVSTFENKENLERIYANYITKSSFPYALQLDTDREIEQYLKGIYDSIVLKDIVAIIKFSAEMPHFYTNLRKTLDKWQKMV